MKEVEAKIERDLEAEISLDLGRRNHISISTVKTDTNIRKEVQARGLIAKGN